jgi:putative peptidoglycan lipid II flippase
VLAPGLPPETAKLAAHLLRITALAIPAVSWSTLFTALLYSERKFAFPAFHQSVVNLSTIAAALLVSSHEAHHSAFGFAAGYAVGAWLQLAAAHGISRRILRPRSPIAEPAKLRPLLAQPAPVLCYSILIGLNPVVTRALASTFGPGATAAFDYSLKMLGVPLALLVVPLSSSLLSEIAPFRLRSDRRAAIGAIGRAAVWTALASTAIVLLMTALAPWLVALLFERGRFSAVSTSMVSSILSGFLPALVAWSVLDVISRSLFSLGSHRIPILAAALALGVNLLLSVLGAIRSVSIHWIGLGAVVGFFAAAALMVAGLRGSRR